VKAKIWDVGLKAKYTLPSTKQRTWKIRPYGELGYTHTSQAGYTESGNNAFAKDIDSVSNSSTRAELGLEFKRSITPTSGWGGAIGYKRILSGVNPELNGTFVGCTDGFTIRAENDRNYLTYNLNIHTALGGKWTGQAEIRGEKSSHNHKEVYSVAAKYHF
jgi:outer membrane autotransporter protein